MTQTLNPPNFRYPFDAEISDQPEGVQNAHRAAFQGILDLNQAIAALHNQVTTGHATNAAAIAETAATITNNTTNVTISNSIGFVDLKTGVSSYATQASDYGSLVVLSNPTAIAITLNNNNILPYFLIIQNMGVGVATLTPTAGTINSVASVAIAQNQFSIIHFDGVNWWAASSGGSLSVPLVFTRGGTILSPTTTVNTIIWYAPFTATVTNVLGYVSGSTGSVINARRNGLTLLTGNLTLGSLDTWIDGGAVQNTAIAIGDKLEIMVVSVSGVPSQIAIEIQCTRP